MSSVPLYRLYLLRAAYLLTSGGLLYNIWPQIMNHEGPWKLWYGVGLSLLGAVSILAAIGLRYPLQMLPVLFFEMIWKTIWFIAVWFPQWRGGAVDADTWQTFYESALVAVFIPIIPWRYVVEHYLLKSGDRWW